MNVVKKERNDGFTEKFLMTEKLILIRKIMNSDDLITSNSQTMKIMILLNEKEINKPEVIKSISSNQRLEKEVLRLANLKLQLMNEGQEKIKKISEVLDKIEVDILKRILYTASIEDIFDRDGKKIWLHSYSTSILMDRILKEKNIKTSINLPLVMLLHDIGRIVLQRYNTKKYEQVLKISKDDNIAIHRTEKAILQIDHSEISRILLEKWNMPEDIIYLVENHHIEEIPDKFIKDIALIQYVDWIDSTTRGDIIYSPNNNILNASNLSSLNSEIAYWEKIHMEFINPKIVISKKTQLISRKLTCDIENDFIPKKESIDLFQKVRERFVSINEMIEDENLENKTEIIVENIIDEHILKTQVIDRKILETKVIDRDILLADNEDEKQKKENDFSSTQVIDRNLINENENENENEMLLYEAELLGTKVIDRKTINN